jgi:predicted lysophospholipase L1 biosynthesis ABC-type transport system permease subunit
VISYAVSLRTRELGIRMALGAARKDVLAMVLRQGLTFVGVGLVTGFATSLLMTRFLSSLLFQVHPLDLVTTLLVSLTLATVALLANYLPARRASRVDPMVALRCEYSGSSAGMTRYTGRGLSGVEWSTGWSISSTFLRRSLRDTGFCMKIAPSEMSC